MNKVNYLSSNEEQSTSEEEPTINFLEGYKIETELDLKLFRQIFDRQNNLITSSPSLQHGDVTADVLRASQATLDDQDKSFKSFPSGFPSKKGKVVQEPKLFPFKNVRNSSSPNTFSFKETTKST